MSSLLSTPSPSSGSVTCVVEVGDLVLFDRRCTSMGPLGASICYGAKALTMTPWDHVGIVVQREDGELCVLDANFSGTACYPLVDRLRRSKSNQIAIRKLYCTRTAAMKQAIRDYAAAITLATYNGDVQQMMQAAFTQVEKSYLSKSKAAKAEADLLRFLWDAPGVSPVLVPSYFLPRHHKEASEAYYATLKEETYHPTSSTGTTQLPKPSSQLYCSQLVADLYQRLGVLPHSPAPPLFIPADFSSSYSYSKLALKPGAVLGKDLVVSLKTAEVVKEDGRIRITQPIDKKQTVSLAPGDVYPVPVGCAVRVTGGNCELMATKVDNADVIAKQLPFRRLGVFPHHHDLVLDRAVHWAPYTTKKDGFHLLAPQKQIEGKDEMQFLVRAVDKATIQCTLNVQPPKFELQHNEGAALINLVKTAAFLVGNTGSSSALHYTEQLLGESGHTSHSVTPDGLLDSIGQYVGVRKYKAGDVILTVGNTERGMMSLVSGAVTAYNPSGATVQVNTKSACFNAEALVDGESLSELRATTDVEVLELTRLGMCVMGSMSSMGVWGQKRDTRVSLLDLTTSLEQHGAKRHLAAVLRLSLEQLPDAQRSGFVSTTTLGMLELLAATGSPISELLSTGVIIIRPHSDAKPESAQATLLSHTINSIRHSIERKSVIARHSTLRRQMPPPKPIATSAAAGPVQILPTPVLFHPSPSSLGSLGYTMQLSTVTVGAAVVLLATKGRFLKRFTKYRQ